MAARRDSKPGIEWSAPADATGIRGYSMTVDRDPNGVPEPVVSTATTRADFPGLGAGAWYAHVRACDGAGNWGPAGHAQITIVGE